MVSKSMVSPSPAILKRRFTISVPLVSNSTSFGPLNHSDTFDRRAGSVHCLKNQQQSITVGRVAQPLQGTQLPDVFFQKFLILLLRLAKGVTIVGHSVSLTFPPGRTRKSFELIFIFIPSVSRRSAV